MTLLDQAELDKFIDKNLAKGYIRPMVMFFGLCNSLATFQQMMDAIFQDEIHKAWVIIYMDDIFIFTRELMINIRHTQRILRKLWDNDLFVKPEKCVFWQNKVEYLGMIIEENKIGMDPVKLRGITDWLLPKTVKDVRSFLGFRNYYRKFIDGYGDLTTPLNKLLRKDEKFEWTPPRQLAFNTLKTRFLEAPVLQTHSSLLWLNRMHLNSHQEWYYNNRTPMEIGTHAAIFHSHSMLWNGTTRSMTGNCWPSSGLSQNGATTYSDPLTLSQFYQITRTSPISGQHRNWTDDKHAGAYSFWNLSSSWYMFPELRWYNQMHSPDDWIYVQKKTWTTRTRHCYAMTSLSVQSTLKPKTSLPAASRHTH